MILPFSSSAPISMAGDSLGEENAGESVDALRGVCRS